MPHRRGLGEHALDQRAETELGRMVLRRLIAEPLAIAGEEYAVLWRGYVATLDGPRWPWHGVAAGPACNGCPDPDRIKFCGCALRKRLWDVATYQLEITVGSMGARLVTAVAIHDWVCPPEGLSALRAGLAALADHFGIERT